ncbi:hypothetical protein VQ042_18000 [Aurantimonas sp. A2-1-M11]|uniref:hypothetical protein n=1 Tax=Aurantimonas sp. A2-1-M11 TaxID=3113712 RepID=UPI002F91EB47
MRSVRPTSVFSESLNGPPLPKPGADRLHRLAPFPPLDRIASGGRAPSAAGSAPVAATPPKSATGAAWPIDLPDEHDAPRTYRAGPFFDPATDTMIVPVRATGDVLLVATLILIASLASVAIGLGLGWMAATLN